VGKFIYILVVVFERDLLKYFKFITECFMLSIHGNVIDYSW